MSEKVTSYPLQHHSLDQLELLHRCCHAPSQSAGVHMLDRCVCCMFHCSSLPTTCFPPCCVRRRLPQKRVLTLNLELPESWLVEPVMALHDLDNLRLADIHEQVGARTTYTHTQKDHVIGMDISSPATSRCITLAPIVSSDASPGPGQAA